MGENMKKRNIERILAAGLAAGVAGTGNAQASPPPTSGSAADRLLDTEINESKVKTITTVPDAASGFSVTLTENGEYVLTSSEERHFGGDAKFLLRNLLAKPDSVPAATTNPDKFAADFAAEFQKGDYLTALLPDGYSIMLTQKGNYRLAFPSGDYIDGDLKNLLAHLTSKAAQASTAYERKNPQYNSLPRTEYPQGTDATSPAKSYKSGDDGLMSTVVSRSLWEEIDKKKQRGMDEMAKAALEKAREREEERVKDKDAGFRDGLIGGAAAGGVVGMGVTSAVAVYLRRKEKEAEDNEPKRG